jgi:molybdate/tungstate transport system substrate-binding protein
LYLRYLSHEQSVAQQHGLRFLELPLPIDLSSPEYEKDYKKVIVQVGFQRFASVGIERVGRPIYYAVTIPLNAPQSKLAVDFVNFVIGKKGQKILEDRRQPPLVPAEGSGLFPVALELHRTMDRKR